MYPKKEETNQLRVFQSCLDQMIDMDNPMVRLSERIKRRITDNYRKVITSV